MTPNGQAGTQYPQPLQMSSCTTTVPNSVRNSDPVGHTSRQAACVQCLHTSDSISQRTSVRSPDVAPSSSEADGPVGNPLSPDSCPESRRGCSMKATCRQVLAPSAPVLSYDQPSRLNPSSGTPFHSLHATSHALQPMQTDVSVKNPMRAGASDHPALDATCGSGPDSCPTQSSCGVRCVLPVCTVIPALLRYSATKRSSAGPVGRRPGWMSHEATFDSWMCTFGSSVTPNRSFAESPATSAFPPTPQ